MDLNQANVEAMKVLFSTTSIVSQKYCPATIRPCQRCVEQHRRAESMFRLCQMLSFSKMGDIQSNRISARTINLSNVQLSAFKLIRQSTSTVCFFYFYLDCGTVPQLLHGSFNIVSTTYPSSANLTCNQGYVSSGNTTISCLSSGNWSLPRPSCIATGQYGHQL